MRGTSAAAVRPDAGNMETDHTYSAGWWKTDPGGEELAVLSGLCNSTGNERSKVRAYNSTGSSL